MRGTQEAADALVTRRTRASLGRGVGILLALALSWGCRERGRSAGPPGSSAAAASAAPPPNDRLEPLRSPTWLIEFPPGPAAGTRVVVPLGARAPRPLVIALPGSADRPEWQCGSYAHASAGTAFVLCPQGFPVRSTDRFTLGTLEQTTATLRAGLPVLKERYGRYVAKGPVVLGALGPGVDYAIDIAREEPSFFAHLVLVDGSLARFSAPIVTRFAKAGGKSVLFVCTRVGCDDNVAGRALALQSQGVAAKVVRLEHATGLDGATAAALRREWSWLVDGDPRWR